MVEHLAYIQKAGVRFPHCPPIQYQYVKQLNLRMTKERLYNLMSQGNKSAMALWDCYHCNWWWQIGNKIPK